jgi:hypothetical protein
VSAALYARANSRQIAASHERWRARWRRCLGRSRISQRIRYLSDRAGHLTCSSLELADTRQIGKSRGDKALQCFHVSVLRWSEPYSPNDRGVAIGSIRPLVVGRPMPRRSRCDAGYRRSTPSQLPIFHGTLSVANRVGIGGQHCVNRIDNTWLLGSERLGSRLAG